MYTALPASDKPLVVLAGPTAAGKSALAVDLAERLGGEVVTADSMQVYIGLDICTDKPSLAERRDVPHHMIDVKYPDETFNAVQYRDMARAIIADIHQRDKLPILSGGTGLYIKGVLDDFLFPAHGADQALRQRLEDEADQKGGDALHRRLQEVDPITASRLHVNDVRRVVRALEVYETTGKPLSQHLTEMSQAPSRYQTAMIALTRPRASLYRRIDERVDRQIQRGLVDEVTALRETYAMMPAAGQALGVKEMMAYLDGETTYEEAVRLLKRDTRRFAKRQFTWFRRDSRFHWFDSEELVPREKLLQAIEARVAAELGGDDRE